ncbi:hypothetical protein [Asanoa ishikariensis]|uniref:hypothetical protein n=1 Tax=Asanoa ishikariensis TaxID=137265 RepID=UPI0015A1FBD0|nr:hypothetical protein [Asanoa ishikariensis]
MRRLHFGGQSFTWRARIRCVQGNGACHRCIRVRAWGAGKTGRALQADLLSATWPPPWGECDGDDAYPTASDVRATIGYALENGWPPAARGGTLVLTEHEHGDRFGLPGFLLTDRLVNPDSPDPTTRVIRANKITDEPHSTATAWAANDHRLTRLATPSLLLPAASRTSHGHSGRFSQKGSPARSANPSAGRMLPR